MGAAVDLSQKSLLVCRGYHVACHILVRLPVVLSPHSKAAYPIFGRV